MIPNVSNKEHMKDILQEKSIKKMPCDIPEGYFDGLKAGLKMIPEQDRYRRRSLQQWTVAAAIAAVIAAGTFLLGRHTKGQEFTEEDYIVYADDSMTDEDIIEYLISTGIEVEELEDY